MFTMILQYCYQTVRSIGGLVGAVVLIALMTIWATSPSPKKYSEFDGASDEKLAVVDLAINRHELSESILPSLPLETSNSSETESKQASVQQLATSFTPSSAIDQRARDAFEQRRQDQAAWQTVLRQPSLATAPYQRRPGLSASVAVVDSLHEVHFVRPPIAAAEIAVSKSQASAESYAPVEFDKSQTAMNTQLPSTKTTKFQEVKSVVQETTRYPAPPQQRTAQAWQTGRY